VAWDSATSTRDRDSSQPVAGKRVHCPPREAEFRGGGVRIGWLRPTGRCPHGAVLKFQPRDRSGPARWLARSLVGRKGTCVPNRDSAALEGPCCPAGRRCLPRGPDGESREERFGEAFFTSRKNVPVPEAAGRLAAGDRAVIERHFAPSVSAKAVICSNLHLDVPMHPGRKGARPKLAGAWGEGRSAIPNQMAGIPRGCGCLRGVFRGERGFAQGPIACRVASAPF